MLSSPTVGSLAGGGSALAAAGAGGGSHRLLWPLAPASAPPMQQPISSNTAPHHVTPEGGFSRYGVYSLFPGAGSPAPGVGVSAVGATLYQQQCSASTPVGRLGPQAAHPGNAVTAFHQPAMGQQANSPHKVADSLFSPGTYTFAPTPPPGSPYSPSLTIPTISTLTPTTDILIKPLPTIITSTPSNMTHQLECSPTKRTSPLSNTPSTTSTEGVREGEVRAWSYQEEQKCCVKSRCACPNKMKYVSEKRGSGCSRTNPVKWSNVAVKREPGITPCQVAEVTTSDVHTTINPIVKLEAAEPTTATSTTHHKAEIHLSQTVTNGNIPVGIAVARQRLHQDISGSPSLASTGDLHMITAPIPQQTVNTHTMLKEVSRITDIDVSAGMAATSGAMGGALVQCGDDRTTGLAAWPIGGTHAHTPTLATPTLWQYPEPVMPFPMPMPPVGFQLVRDPVSGHFLLIPTASIEQAMVWPSYSQPSSHVLLPPLPPPPLAPLQLLSSAPTDYLATSTTLHQHTQTHSTRLVALTTSDHKRKVPLPLSGHTLIKIEADCTATSTLDHTKAVQQTVSTVSSNSGAVFTDNSVTPLLTTHVFYQHPGNLILSSTQSTETTCKSQATSPVMCLTPPPECAPLHHEEETCFSVQDASNQTDTHILDEDSRNDCLEDMEIIRSPSKMLIEVKKTSELLRIPTPVPETIEIIDNTDIQEELDEETIKIENKPDISGLELLSNSIVEYESCRKLSNEVSIKFEARDKNEVKEEHGDDVLKGIAHMTIKDKESESSMYSKNMDDNLGGLNLLCALAEQRFVEEVLEKQQEEDYKHYKQYKKPKDLEERRNNKFKTKLIDNDLQPKKIKYSFNDRRIEEERINEVEREKIRENEIDLEKEKLSVLKRVADERGISSDKCKRDLSYDFGAIDYDKKKTERNQNETDVDVIKTCSCEEDRNRNYKELSDDELQKYNQNSREWSTTFISAVERNMREKLADLHRQYKEKQLQLSKLTPKKVTECGDCSKRSQKPQKTERSPSPPVLDKVNTSPLRYKSSPDLLRPPTLCAVVPTEEPKIPTQETSLDTSFEAPQKRKSLDATPDKISSSKKRKVGRPKKLLSAPGLRVATETIVAKKPKTKNGIVGFLLAAKNRLQMQSKNGLVVSKSPPRYIEEKPKHKSKSQHKKKSSVTSSSGSEFKKRKHRSSKIRPKLKAEPKLKKNVHEEEDCSEWEISMPVEEEIQVPVEEPMEPEETPTSIQNARCILTADHLDKDKMRVLTAMGGLFYAGQLTAIQAPDVYAITLDGERGNRPHIMSREEILRDAIVEVSPQNTSELLPGTRMCAYWSQQYRCLYPGTVAEPGTPDPLLDMKFVCVEFDDGDSGRIAIEDIRLLPSDYPIIEYDPNPLLSLSKRRRRTSVNSVTEERRISQTINTVTNIQAIITPPEPQKIPVSIAEKENTDTNKQDTFTESYRERKKLKKRRKDKLKKMFCKDDKTKKRKHRCCDEHCKHRKHHKKHKKHRKHHHRTENEVAIVVENENENESEKQYDEIIEQEEENDEVNGNIIEETNIVHTKILESKAKKAKKGRERQESVESRSKMAAFLPARQLWGWCGKGYKRVGIRGRARKQFFKAIQRGKESIMVGDCAVFLSTGRPDRPYIGRIEAMWESWGTNMVVKVKWFYHPEETVGCPPNLQYPGALFESPHIDENDVQTISHKCEVLPLKEYTNKLGSEPHCYDTIYENNDIYYLAGYYDPTIPTLTMEPDIPIVET